MHSVFGRLDVAATLQLLNIYMLDSHLSSAFLSQCPPAFAGRSVENSVTIACRPREIGSRPYDRGCCSCEGALAVVASYSVEARIQTPQAMTLRQAVRLIHALDTSVLDPSMLWMLGLTKVDMCCHTQCTNGLDNTCYTRNAKVEDRRSMARVS